LTSPLDTVADMRATAKWIVGAAAAVGAALLGGAPLTAIGKIHSLHAAALAYSGLVIGLAGVGWTIWHATEALTPVLSTSGSFETDPALAGLRARIDREPGAFYGPWGSDFAALCAARTWQRKIRRSLAALLVGETDEARRHALTAALEQAAQATWAIEQRIRLMQELTHVWLVRAQLQRARVHVIGGAAVTALGIVLFIAST
jgi:hypothetical protein